MVRPKVLCSALICLFLFPAFGIASESIFKSHIIFTNPTVQNRSVSLGDLNGDSHLDIMVAESFTGNFVWYKNNGSNSPSFTKAVVGGGRRTPTNVFSADINGDTFLDVVALSVVDDQISYYANDGASNPTFTNMIIDTDPNPNDPNDEGYTDDPRIAHAGDLDGDGDLDVAVSAVGDDKIAWFENNGATWTPHTLTNTLDGARAVWIADLNGDNHNDVIGGPWFGNTLTWWQNDGNPEPSFTERTMIEFPPNPNPWPEIPPNYDTDPNGPIEDGLMWRIVTEDMDNDGDIDVIAARRNHGVVEWYENDGESVPTFTRHTLLDVYNGGKSVATLDVNMDGHMDIVFAARGDSRISWFENMGNASSFEEHILYLGAGEAGYGARSVFAGDIDNDGDPDFAWVALSSGNVVWEENLTIQRHADFDHDGDVDSDDLTIWEGATGLNSGADADGDGDSDSFDFLIWQREYTGSLTPPISGAVETVPEPTSLFLLGLGAMLACHRRSR